MPKDSLKQGHRGIGFITFTSPEPVDTVMAMPHSLHGVELAIDSATPKEGREGRVRRLASYNLLAGRGGRRESNRKLRMKRASC